MARAKRLEYTASVERDGRLLVAGEAPLAPPDGWTAEHLLLAALGRCTLASLAFHAKRGGMTTRGSAAESGVVTKREEDGRYAFVEIECGVDVELEPEPETEALRELLRLSERDCFIGASLTVAPRYEWRVNGRLIRP